ncbi:hypothetical protein ymoll0001_6540 [Yersinia mollaretii ATCC 43969]|uniref:Uncharacterized protein n=1 Tax=Yersinia mollaretii (strain ATCC 43969 / DSM 18520 / CIP 103324 / CNY 7263 / WAIP 204) TaxID=349967 RepID=A0ABM9Y7N6_YERMW|nr:hypothetical protein ymoll0001_6540 [Yersinia mollaretii ATCC 43969]
MDYGAIPFLLGVAAYSAATPITWGISGYSAVFSLIYAR